MSKMQVVLNLLAIFATSSIIPMRRRHRHTTSSSTEGQYFFEGVDYNLLPEDVQSEHNDCYGQHHRCIRRKTYFTPVCGYDYRNSYYEDFYSPCEIELFSCKYRVEHNYGGVFGNEYNKDVIFYNGEELNCLYYYKRSRNSLEMDMLYTGTKNPPYRSLPKPEMYMRGTDEKPVLPLTKEMYIRGFDGTPNFHGSNETNKRGSNGTQYLGDLSRVLNVRDVKKLPPSRPAYN